eukprot:TRINITY_DN11616_c0_g2_i1.p1 TRINITY_DN11616_c0_g2~~TRINITY_DN11616_c0_g2_i1.p1  ORF type:complete len:232 (+),score=36.61 TRINITY_DN11616_c0_g2_i1:184-879(+)
MDLEQDSIVVPGDDSLQVHKAAADIFIELLEVAIHTILCIREIYPAAIFERCLKYGVPVHKARHPDVQTYVVSVLKAIQPWIVKGKAKTIAIHILDAANHPVERFVFDLDGVPLSNLKHNIDVEAALRGLMIKINTCDSMLAPPPKGCSFAVYVLAKPEVEEPLSQDMTMPFVQATPLELSMSLTADDSEPTTAHPLRTVDLGLFSLAVYVEESVAQKRQTMTASQRSSGP